MRIYCTNLLYNYSDVQYVWKQFVSLGSNLENVEKFRYDLIDITRQALSDIFFPKRSINLILLASLMLSASSKVSALRIASDASDQA